MSSFVWAGVRSVAGKITRPALDTRTSRPPASTRVSSLLIGPPTVARAAALAPWRSAPGLDDRLTHVAAGRDLPVGDHLVLHAIALHRRELAGRDRGQETVRVGRGDGLAGVDAGTARVLVEPVPAQPRVERDAVVVLLLQLDDRLVEDDAPLLPELGAAHDRGAAVDEVAPGAVLRPHAVLPARRAGHGGAGTGGVARRRRRSVGGGGLGG